MGKTTWLYFRIQPSRSLSLHLAFVATGSRSPASSSRAFIHPAIRPRTSSVSQVSANQKARLPLPLPFLPLPIIPSTPRAKGIKHQPHHFHPPHLERMEELISPTSSCSPPHPAPFFSLPTLQHRLQYLLQARPEWWAYAIFWRDSPDRHLLSFGEGHFRGVRARGSGDGGGVQTLLSDDTGTVDGDDTEWFYVVSLSRSFAAGDLTVPARSYGSLAPVWLTGAHALQTCGCDRAREAQLHGIETLVCVPLSEGVLELGSSDLIVPPLPPVLKKELRGGITGLSSSVDSEHSDSKGIEPPRAV